MAARRSNAVKKAKRRRHAKTRKREAEALAATLEKRPSR